MLGMTLVFISGSKTRIYTCTGGGEYTIPYRNIIIEKANTYLIPPSNTWWINNTEFREAKLMMSASLSLHEEIC
jgi:hypothetical protein